jgi:DNA replication protein DnaC
VDSLKQYGENLTTHVEEGEGLVLFGKQGTGKDHLMAGMLFHAARIGFTVRLVNGMDMYRGVSETWGTDAKESDRLKELTGPDILAISDPLPPTGKLQDYQTNFLYSVIDQRYRKMKPTWVTANFFSGKDAAERLSSQVADRMKDGALTLYCNWPSYRKSLVKQP